MVLLEEVSNKLREEPPGHTTRVLQGRVAEQWDQQETVLQSKLLLDES